MPRVSIVQRILPHYRLAFFERLHAELDQRGIDLRLCYGQEQQGTRPGSAEIQGGWVRRVRNRYLFESRARRAAVWQPCLRELMQSDLVIAEHASRLLINYPLALLSRLGGARLALWGHGTNLQTTERDELAQRARDAQLQGAHWWFAYTALSARLVADAGYPRDRITVVNNSIDTTALGDAVAAISSDARDELRRELDLPASGVGIFCGRLVAEKRLDLLRAAGELVHARRPDFRLIVIGDGPGEAEVRRMASECAWVRFVGPKYGAELAPYLAVSDFMLMPGLVGLVIVDSFAAGVPLITTDHRRHSPEIEYLRDGENALVTEVRADALAAGIVTLMDSGDKLLHLKSGCRASAHEYTLERMVDRFSAGVLAALEAA
jgi:glycosyltransferase involved in cell wall biosynthesis